MAVEAETARASRKSYEALSAHETARREEYQKNSRASLAEKRPELMDIGVAAAALKEMEALLAAHPRAMRMTRKGVLVDDDEKALATFGNLVGMKAWLFQNGFRASVDDRAEFFAAAK